MASTLTAEYVRSILDYEAAFGNLIWRYRDDKPIKWNSRCAGKIAGEKSPKKYQGMTIDGRKYQCHQVVWLHCNGTWPSSEIDHIDRNKHNNKIENLRLVDRCLNMHNTAVSKRNTSGYRGVSWHKKASKWQVHLTVNKVPVFRGLFNCPTEAHLAYQENAAKYLGEYARTA